MNFTCIYCRKNESNGPEHRLTDEHIIPRVLGGWISLPIVCKKCNNRFGHKFESKLKKNVFIVTALEKLKIQPPQKAYKHANILMNFEDTHTTKGKMTSSGIYKIIPTKQKDDSLIISEDESKEVLKKQIKRYEKEHGTKINFDLNFFDEAPFGIAIPIYPTDICFIKHKRKRTKILIKNLTEPIPFVVPAKIVFAHLAGLHYEFALDECFDIIRKSILQNNMNGKILLNTMLRRVKNPGELDFKHYHFIKYSIVKNDLVALVGLFGTILFSVYLGSLDSVDLGNDLKKIFNDYHVYDLKNENIFPDIPPKEIIESHKLYLNAIQVFANYELNIK